MARRLGLNLTADFQIRNTTDGRVYRFEAINFSLTEPSYAYVSFRQVDGGHQFTRRFHVMGLVEGLQRFLNERSFEVL